MDVDQQYTDITYIASRVDAVQCWFEVEHIAITGQFSFKDMRAIFIRDPERSIIKMDEYANDEPATRSASAQAYPDHPQAVENLDMTYRLEDNRYRGDTAETN